MKSGGNLRSAVLPRNANASTITVCRCGILSLSKMSPGVQAVDDPGFNRSILGLPVPTIQSQGFFYILLMSTHNLLKWRYLKRFIVFLDNKVPMERNIVAGTLICFIRFYPLLLTIEKSGI